MTLIVPPISDAAARPSRVRRSVRSHGDGHVIVLAQTFPVPVPTLWDAITTPERVSRWLGRLQRTLPLGGAYRLPDMGITGRITRSEPPHRFAATWEFGNETSTIEVEVAPTPNGSSYTLEHRVADADHWALFGPAATGIGWDVSLLALARHLADPDADQVAQLAGLSRTEDGRAFLRASAAAWERAHLDSGADPGFVRESARRTSDFYLGRG